MGITVEITNAPHRGGKTVRVTSGDRCLGERVFTTNTVMTPFMSIGMRFEEMIDRMVREHCQQKANAEFNAWKEGR